MPPSDIKIKESFCIVLACLISTLWAQGQVENYNFDFIAIPNYDVQTPVTSIIQDQNGFIWIGTLGSGLYRYDGTNYVLYTHDWNSDTSINSNTIHSIYIDIESRLWVGTDVGLNLYHSELNQFEHINLKSETGVNIDFTAIHILEDRNYDLLVATYDRGLLRIKLGNFEVSHIHDGVFTSAMTKDKAGKIFVALSSDLYYFDEGNNKLIALNQLWDDNTAIDDYGTITSLFIDNDDVLWVGTNTNGVFKISRKSGEFSISQFAITDKKILTMSGYKEGLLIGSENDGLFVIDKNGKIINQYVRDKNDSKSLESNSIWSLYIDGQNRVWVGTFNSGVEVHNELYSKFQTIESTSGEVTSLQSSSVTTIERDKSGMLWLGYDKGVDIYNPFTKKVKHIKVENEEERPGLDNNLNVERIYIDSNDNIWIATWNRGIYMLKNGAKEFIKYNVESTQGRLKTNTIRDFSEDSKGRIWIASFLRGLHYFDLRTNQLVYCDSEPFKSTNLINADPIAVFVDSEDIVWVGTSSGLFKVDDKGENGFSVTNMRPQIVKEVDDHPSIHKTLAIYESKDGLLWFGTNGYGLLSYDKKTEKFKVHNEEYGIRASIINAIIEAEDGTLWTTGKSGITCIDRKENKSTNYSIDDGLLSNDFNNGSIEKDLKGMLYFGSYLGVNFFNPKEKPKINTHESNIKLVGLKLFNEEVKPNDETSILEKDILETASITFAHDQSVFTIEYVGISHTRPEKNEYAYRLEGFDDNWNFVGQTRTATYTNLQPGAYVFKVKASNNDGIWNEQPLSLMIRVLPPWWKTNLAYLLYALFAIGSVYFITAFSRKRFKEKQTVLMEREKRLQEEHLHKAQLRFFTNISHEFRTPLTLIINPIKDILQYADTKLPVSMQKKHEIIHKNADRLSRLINELMDFRKLKSNKIELQAEQVNAVSAVADIVDYFVEEAVHRNIVLHFETPLEELWVWLDYSMLEKILFNILSNAFKVTPNGGKVTVNLNKKGKSTKAPSKVFEDPTDKFEITVADTGPGIDQKDYKRIFKRFYQVGSHNKYYYGSSGVGLEMVKGFVELHHGSIEVESELQKGAKFIITLPIGKETFRKEALFKVEKTPKSVLDKEVKVPQASGTDLEVAQTTANNAENLPTVLIVEDNIDLQEYLKSELNDAYHVLVSSNGKEGWQIACAKVPDLIITDVVMPIMDGLELCRQVKAEVTTSHIPILMLTSKAMVEDRIKGIDSGADAYIDKPFDIQVVKSTLQQLLISRKILFDKYHQNNTITAPESTTRTDNEFIRRVLEYVYENIEESDLGVEFLSSQFYLSRSQLYRKIKALTGKSANEFIKKIRLEKAKELLISNTDYNVNEVAYKVGFTSPSYFTKCFKKEYGYLPTQMGEF